MAADLHLHSIYSDGSYTPEELVKEASESGLSTIALSDHDTVRGIKEALQAGKEFNIKVIPALELSVFQDKNEIHILGFYIDYEHKLLRRKIAKIYEIRINRARKMIEKLNNIGVNITFNEAKNFAGDNYIGRPHIAQAMVKAGFIDEMAEAFCSDYIGIDGRAYEPKYHLKPREAINLIRKSRGIPVIAHPFFVKGGKHLNKKDLEQLMELGLEGVEVYHSKQSEEISDYYYRMAQELDLLVTGGSDFHGENSPGVKMGDIKIEDYHVEKLEKRWRSLYNLNLK